LLLLLLGLLLKYTLLDPSTFRLLPAFVIATGVPTVLEDIRACRLFYINYSGRPEFTAKSEEKRTPSASDKRPAMTMQKYGTGALGRMEKRTTGNMYTKLDMRDAIGPAIRWANSHWIITRTIGKLFAIIACVVIVCSNDVMQAVAAENDTVIETMCGKPRDQCTWESIHLLSEDPRSTRWLMLHLRSHGYPHYTKVAIFFSIAALCFALSFLPVLFMPSQRMGVLHRSVITMLSNDVSPWLGLLMTWMLTWGMVVLLSYPTNFGAGPAGIVGSFETFTGSLQAMIELALFGKEFALNIMQTGTDGTLSLETMFGDTFTSELPPDELVWAGADAIFFLIAYVAYMVMALILLLNLLIAMMSSTYEQIMEHATLQWRIHFARLVLKIELECQWLTRPRMWCRPWDLRAGEPTDNEDGTRRYVYHFKHVEKNIEGYEVEGGATASLGGMFFDKLFS